MSGSATPVRATTSARVSKEAGALLDKCEAADLVPGIVAVEQPPDDRITIGVLAGLEAAAARGEWQLQRRGCPPFPPAEHVISRMGCVPYTGMSMSVVLDYSGALGTKGGPPALALAT